MLTQFFARVAFLGSSNNLVAQVQLGASTLWTGGRRARRATAPARYAGRPLENAQKDYASAEKNLMEGLKLDQESPQGHYELAKTYWAMGRWQEAEPHA